MLVVIFLFITAFSILNSFMFSDLNLSSFLLKKKKIKAVSHCTAAALELSATLLHLHSAGSEAWTTQLDSL